jgi:hypothetical protein
MRKHQRDHQREKNFAKLVDKPEKRGDAGKYKQVAQRGDLPNMAVLRRRVVG